ncbi:MAG: DUF2061 domain-containing protein [Bacteroidales bacterium]|nr:DUF2061 domain-containing protein [Bacteroidales bacterium]
MIIENLFIRKKTKGAIGIKIKDRPLKSIIKAISWRLVGTCDTVFISWLLTGRAVVAFSIGGVEVFSKIALYYVHERVWTNLRWGRMMVRLRKRTKYFKIKRNAEKEFLMKIERKHLSRVEVN